MTAPATRIVFAVASHLHMSAGAVRKSMSSYEVMCWWQWLNEAHEAARTQADDDAPLVLDVEAEIAAWPS
ncbi:hypothetical protein [Caballeronia zhejiangensis]|uniref:hypothetical protein n=1 Tax=Caballeronia zhejiangensis TaxID=871203 RepID=UPI00158AB193|nr:hypothetical protein [Caballeronia zhejiangensis]MCG7403010.1 hypothetical protein [Caballeronia zhejiangensis]MCI1043834.1 hypothetical protein [Caballeronia zhejiangensis]